MLSLKLQKKDGFEDGEIGAPTELFSRLASQCERRSFFLQ